MDFLSTHPGHHVNPKRVNGSAIETLFGQLKHTTSSNLTGSNYEMAKATLLTKRCIHGRKSESDYRNTPLNIRQMVLKKRITKVHYLKSSKLTAFLLHMT